MLYLKLPPKDSANGEPNRIALCEQTALRFERALLCENRASRRDELLAAFAIDRDAAGWALRAAENRLGRTVNRADEAADWLCRCLEEELAASLTTDSCTDQADEIEWRLSALVARLNKCSRQDREFQNQLEHEKLESLKELAYGASHEINNPLANIAARAQTLLVDESDPERRRKLAAIHRQAMRAHEMIADLMLFARPPKLTRVECDLGELASSVVDQLRSLATEYRVELLLEERAEAIRTVVDAIQIGVAVHAVIVNALEALGGGGHVWVAVRRAEHEGKTFGEIAVRDDGPGISEEVRKHMFDPFYSGREAGRGLGFGLSKCWRIVTDHGGRVVVQRPVGGGTEIVLRLPIAASEAVRS